MTAKIWTWIPGCLLALQPLRAEAHCRNSIHIFGEAERCTQLGSQSNSSQKALAGAALERALLTL